METCTFGTLMSWYRQVLSEILDRPIRSPHWLIACDLEYEPTSSNRLAAYPPLQMMILASYGPLMRQLRSILNGGCRNFTMTVMRKYHEFRGDMCKLLGTGDNNAMVRTMMMSLKDPWVKICSGLAYNPNGLMFDMHQSTDRKSGAQLQHVKYGYSTRFLRWILTHLRPGNIIWDYMILKKDSPLGKWGKLTFNNIPLAVIMKSLRTVISNRITVGRNGDYITVDLNSDLCRALLKQGRHVRQTTRNTCPLDMTDVSLGDLDAIINHTLLRYRIE